MTILGVRGLLYLGIVLAGGVALAAWGLAFGLPLEGVDGSQVKVNVVRGVGGAGEDPHPRPLSRGERGAKQEERGAEQDSVELARFESRQLQRPVIDPPQVVAPGHPRRKDHHYERKVVRALFLFVDPLRGWRRVSHRESRKRLDWAYEVKQLFEVDYPKAELVTLVCDNLNTHDIASLYATSMRRRRMA